MRVLLPPSEAKTAGGRGRPLAARPQHGPLAPARAELLDALGALLAGPSEAAMSALQLPPGVAAEALATNRNVRRSPTTAALRRYAGVVYDGLDVAGLDAAARRVAGRSALIFSGLWGVVRGDEPIPAYRVPAKAVLPGIGVAGTFWRHVLDEHLPAMLDTGAIVDLRSSDYAAMWRPRGEAAQRTISVRVLSPLPRGGHGVLSYNSKLAKGRLAAALFARVADRMRVESASDVVATWHDCTGGRGEVSGRTSAVLYTG